VVLGGVADNTTIDCLYARVTSPYWYFTINRLVRLACRLVEMTLATPLATVLSSVGTPHLLLHRASAAPQNGSEQDTSAHNLTPASEQNSSVEGTPSAHRKLLRGGGSGSSGQSSSASEAPAQWSGYVVPTLTALTSYDLLPASNSSRPRVVGIGSSNLLLGGMLLHQVCSSHPGRCHT
jgi:hypothetical protein